ncbi:MAG: hypothetical protein KatS3mg051_1846 [Anaerolineae bacterium]|nr:MAG: hypothetical protein KatS3mg051_1846 [Anaerolineae bacterium]
MSLLVAIIVALVERHGEARVAVFGDWVAVQPAEGSLVRVHSDEAEDLLWRAVRALGDRYVVTGTDADEVVRLRRAA